MSDQPTNLRLTPPPARGGLELAVATAELRVRILEVLAPQSSSYDECLRNVDDFARVMGLPPSPTLETVLGERAERAKKVKA